MAIQRVRGREHPLREALADDHHLFAVAPIGFVEIAAGDDRHAERGEKSRRDGPEPRPRILLAVRLGVALDGELGGEEAGVAPRHGGADRDALDARQLADLSHRFPVEA